MSISSFVRSVFVPIFILGVISFTAPVFAQFNTIAGKLIYPVRDLGNCKDFASCQVYCTKNATICASYLERKGYITKDQGNLIRSLYGTSTVNTKTSTQSSSKTATPSYANTPVTLSVPDAQTVQSSVVLYVDAPQASRVQILGSDSASILPTVLGEAVRGSEGEWVYTWDTTTLAEGGNYTLTPLITTDTSVYNGLSTTVAVSNPADSKKVTTPSAEDLSKLATTIFDTKEEVLKKQEEVTTQITQATSDYLKEVSQSLPVTDKTEETRAWLATKEKEIVELADAASRMSATSTTSVTKLVTGALVPIKAGAEDMLGKKIATSTLDQELSTKLSTAETALSETNNLLTTRVGTAVTTDSDGDGISDYDELFIYHTNILAPDTDKDGAPDETEIKDTHTDPTSSSPAVIVPEDVQTVGETAEKLLTVTDVKAGELGTDTKGKPSVKSIVFRGKSLPNSYVTLFIFSDPVVVTVKTNKDGEWEYTFTKDLPDGSHQIYTAIVGNAGKVLAKSLPVPFVKQAGAVSFGPNVTVTENSGIFSLGSIILIISLIGVAIVGILVLVGISQRNKKNQNNTQPPAVPPLASSL